METLQEETPQPNQIKPMHIYPPKDPLLKLNFLHSSADECGCECEYVFAVLAPVYQ
jgi:hypothetical protein